MLGPSPSIFRSAPRLPGSPAPWREGFVVLFVAPGGSTWIGNFKPGSGGATRLIDWPKAATVLVLATGACCFVRKNESEGYTMHASDRVHSVLLAPEGDLLLIADFNGVTAYRSDCSIAWRQMRLEHTHVEMMSFSSDGVWIEVEPELGEDWLRMGLSMKDGSILA